MTRMTWLNGSALLFWKHNRFSNNQSVFKVSVKNNQNNGASPGEFNVALWRNQFLGLVSLYDDQLMRNHSSNFLYTSEVLWLVRSANDVKGKSTESRESQSTDHTAHPHHVKVEGHATLPNMVMKRCDWSDSKSRHDTWHSLIGLSHWYKSFTPSFDIIRKLRVVPEQLMSVELAETWKTNLVLATCWVKEVCAYQNKRKKKTPW